MFSIRLLAQVIFSVKRHDTKDSLGCNNNNMKVNLSRSTYNHSNKCYPVHADTHRQTHAHRCRIHIERKRV